MSELCDECGREMVMTFEGSYHEPQEHCCPVCDLGALPHEVDGWDEPDMDLIDELRPEEGWAA